MPSSPTIAGLPPGALDGLRVVELASPLGHYCAKMFAELGAEVILVEPPQGAASRGFGPFIGGEPGSTAGATHSLSFSYLNTSKRGITLDLHSPKGAEAFRRLAATADLVIECERPGLLDSLGCGYEALSRLRPALVMTSITGFGQDGPYAHYAADDLTGIAAGGFLYLGGYPDSQPVGACSEQGYAGASMFGAVASMIALTQAERTGQGDQVDVSMQECMVLAMENAVQFYDLEGTVRKRSAGRQRFAGTGVYACADGHVYMMAGGIGANRFWQLTLQWFREEGVPGLERLLGEEWTRTEYLESDEAKAIFMEVFGAWARSQPKARLYAEGQRRHVPVAAIQTPADLAASAQLAARGYFVDVPHPALDAGMRMPGAPYRLAATPWRLRGPAPTLGQDNAAVFAELGLQPEPAAAVEGAF
ncbi:CaiB/BaiF CoA transferase family protein [Paracidovorax cattleyae]|uniref:Benzylsuccinate CoA-transferase BbsE subunit n=1 Tax=Paracidovorax cattleyae TaxID=80868 RepID=A0A1H0WAE8_9BURK|nr:CoA transferase [Paracidovorax cattleyae]SDP87608.1 benzylsuccinate CoA-transferase BbsE subunit [Paracidovorax cattleyae]